MAIGAAVWRLAYVCPNPPLERYSSEHSYALVDVRRGDYLALDIGRYPRVRRLLSGRRKPRDPRIFPRCYAGEGWQGLIVSEGGRSSELLADRSQGPISMPLRALWIASQRDPTRSTLEVLIEDGPLDLTCDEPGIRELWHVSGRPAAEGIRVDFTVDHEFSR